MGISDPDRRARNIENAVTGYKTALCFSQLPDRVLTDDRLFQEKLAHLKELLRELGREV
jgi:hypothetical protein